MRTKLLLGAAFVAVVAVSFYAGGEFRAHGGSLTSLPTVSGVDYTPVSGTIVSSNETSLTIELGDGSNTTVPLNQDTQMLFVPAPVPADAAEFPPGAIVFVEIQNGVAQMVRILAAPTN